MKILIIGSGGREHAIALKLHEENNQFELYISPGNGGTETICKNIDLDLNNHQEVTEFCKNSKIDLVIIGPEQPLVDGLADYLRNNYILVFGPSKNAARIEGDKEFAKNLMARYNIPTASFKSFKKEDYQNAVNYLKKSNYPIVLKASGLAAGKGVIIATSFEEANLALTEMMKNSVFGSAGDTVVIEDFLEGEELSVFVVTDGKNYFILPPSQDHKRIGEGDTGKNTGGMGAYSPVKFVNDHLINEIEKNVIVPTLNGLKINNSEFNGCLYCGLIKTKEGIKVIEFNCRFGDPEIQAVLQLIDGSFSELLLSTAKGNINKNSVHYNGKSSICVVAASGGYPDSYEKGYEINGVLNNEQNLKIIHAGTKKINNKIITNGGRVLNIVGISSNNDLSHSKTIAYDALSKINFEKMYFRKDIGFKAL
ncbi:MAG: phosphoribosylamine--glycine ligase [Ignavibacteriales bacterium]|nr:phosphoribosylamine--glycine ligase [Ignavibacteriales bacterium]